MKTFLLSLFWCAAITASSYAVNAPTTGRATPAGPKSIALTWADNSEDETGFDISDDGGATVLASVPANQTYYYDRSITAPSTTKSYYVRATGTPDSAWVAVGSATTTIQMNILFFFADDMGPKDIVALRNYDVDGPTIHETPALDTLCDQSMVFNNFYASGPRCVVARRAILTGRYDWREDKVTFDGSGLAPGVVTYGDAVTGYWKAYIGKYHLGESNVADNNGPKEQGFDYQVAAGHKGAPAANDGNGLAYFPNPTTGLYKTLSDVEYNNGAGEGLNAPAPISAHQPAGQTTNRGEEYLTDRITLEAIKFIDDWKNNHSAEPFFCTVAHFAVHTAIEAKESDVTYFKNKKANMAAELATHPQAATPLLIDTPAKNRQIQDNIVYAAMVKDYDDSLAAIRAHLAETDDPNNPGKKLSETTIIVVSADHGSKADNASWSSHVLEDDNDPVDNYSRYRLDPDNFTTESNFAHYPATNYPFRHGKTWCYEGGIKTPLIVYIPGVTVPDHTDALTHGADLFASFCDMAGVAQQPTEAIDSVSFMLPAMNPSAAPRKESFHYFTNTQTGSANPALGVYRRGDYKLIYYIVQRKYELYNLAADPYERNDLASSRPDMVDEMKEILRKHIVSALKKAPTPGKPATKPKGTWPTEQEILVESGLLPSGLPDAPDAAPTWSGSGATQTSPTTVELQWNVNATNATHSVIYRKDPGGSFREIAFLPVVSGVNTFIDRELTNSVQYKYKVESENIAGWNGWVLDTDYKGGGKFTEGTSVDGTTNTGVKSITLGAASDFAIVAVDDSITITPGELREFLPTTNDSGENLLTITSITAPTAGTATTDGTRIYFQAPADFLGNVTMDYTITDSAGQTDTATVTFILPISAPAVTAREAWEFNDTSGANLKTAHNSGTWNSEWNGVSKGTTNGSGILVIPGDQGTFTKKLPQKGTANAQPADNFYATPVTTGKYRFEVKFASWSADAASDGDTWTTQVNDSSGTRIASVDVSLLAAGVDITLGTSPNNFTTTSYALSESSAHTFAIEFDFDNDTVDYLIDGSVTNSFAFTGSDIGQILFKKTGAWTTADTTLSLDSISLFELEPGDTLYDSWATTHAWNGILPAQQAPEEDADGDGIDNLVEFAFGTSPSEPNAYADLGITLNAAGDTLSFTPWRDTSAILYDVQFADDLIDWGRTDAFAPIHVNSSAGDPVEINLPTGTHVFSRVKVSTP